MATKTTKKTPKKTKPRHVYRNASTALVRTPRAIAVRPRGPIAADLAAEDELEEKEKKKKEDTPGWTAIKAAGGALASTVLGAYVAQQDWLPPKVMTGVITGLGAVLALEGPPKLKSLGIGAMAAATGQLGFMLIDDQLIKSADDKHKKEQVASKPAAPPAKKQSNAGDIPADALARAYERARLRMALTSDTPN
jgi:hypothetical protein